MNLWDFTGKTILITGASSGIGEATAKLLAQMNARLILVARKQDVLQQLHASLPSNQHVIESFDLNRLTDINSWLLELTKHTGPIDGLAHCAGIHMARPIRLTTPENVEEILRVNVTSGIMLAKSFRQKQISNKPASIVFLASVVGIVGQIGVLPYATSKGALIAAAKSLALELASESIRVNCILPGVVKTPMSDKLFKMMGTEQIDTITKAHPLGLGDPTDVANSIAFLLSGAAKWITGTNLIVDGGYTAI